MVNSTQVVQNNDNDNKFVLGEKFTTISIKITNTDNYVENLITEEENILAILKEM